MIVKLCFYSKQRMVPTKKDFGTENEKKKLCFSLEWRIKIQLNYSSSELRTKSVLFEQQLKIKDENQK